VAILPKSEKNKWFSEVAFGILYQTSQLL